MLWPRKPSVDRFGECNSHVALVIEENSNATVRRYATKYVGLASCHPPAHSLTIVKCLKRSRPAECVYTERGLRRNAARQQAASMRAKVAHLEKLFQHLKDCTVSNVQLVDPGAQVLQDADNTLSLSPCLKTTLPSRPAGNTYYVSPSRWESVMDNVRNIFFTKPQSTA